MNKLVKSSTVSEYDEDRQWSNEYLWTTIK